MSWTGTTNEALTTAFANLRGARDKDLIRTARALEHLKSLPEYGNNERVGEAVAISREMVREFLSLLELPTDVQQLIECRKLGLEQGRKLRQLQRKRSDDVLAAATAMTDLSAHDARHLVDLLLRSPQLDVASAKEKLLGEKTVNLREYHVVAILAEPEFKRLELEARKRGARTPSALVTRIVSRWLEEGSPDVS